jgi:hypothetical protein
MGILGYHPIRDWACSEEQRVRLRRTDADQKMNANVKASSPRVSRLAAALSKRSFPIEGINRRVQAARKRRITLAKVWHD